MANELSPGPGPLDSLPDWDAVSLASELPSDFQAQFAQHGVRLLWVRPEGLGDGHRQGTKQVFITDLENWRRPVVCRDTVLAVVPLTSP